MPDETTQDIASPEATATPAVDQSSTSAQEPVNATTDVEVVPVLGSEASTTQAPDQPFIKGASITGPLGDPAALDVPAVFVPADAVTLHLTTGEQIRVAHAIDDIKGMLDATGFVKFDRPEGDSPRYISTGHVVHYE